MSEKLTSQQQRERDMLMYGMDMGARPQTAEQINSQTHGTLKLYERTPLQVCADAIQEEIARRLHIPAPVVTRETRLEGGVIAAVAWLEQDRDMRNGSPAWHALAELRRALADCKPVSCSIPLDRVGDDPGTL